MAVIKGAITVYFLTDDEGKGVGVKLCSCGLSDEQRNDVLGLSGCMAMAAETLLMKAAKITTQSWREVLLTVDQMHNLNNMVRDPEDN